MEIAFVHVFLSMLTLRTVSGLFNTTLVGLADGSVKTINIDTNATLASINSHSSQVNKIIRVNTQQYLTASQDSTIKLWNVNDSCFCGDSTHNQPVKSVVIVPNGLLISGACDGSLRAWNTSTLLLFTIPAHSGCVNDLKYHPSLKAIVSVGDDRLVKVWNVSITSFSLVQTLTPTLNQSINCVEILII